jgi:AraC family transcriptional regulator of adaptative response/methylated-DNA-[protein]-cysteine methyltransferase
MHETRSGAPHETDDARRWRSVLTRDADADGRFVYAVRSTKIYCRPSCPSRRPRRDRVEFFRQPMDAERSGYRACKRCRPNQPAPSDPWIAKIQRACLWLAAADTRPSLAALARKLGGSPYHLQRNFKRLVGLTPRAYTDACRMGAVKRALHHGDDVTAAVYGAGYGSSSRFYERASSRLGMLPSTYRRGGSGMSIHYTIVDSSMGQVLVAATGRGICAVAMGASGTELKCGLAREYPAATITASDGAMTRWTAEILARLAGRMPHLALPLDVRATAFQWQVWQALAAIPSGETRTYGEIASAIGQPRAARAVARACATNPVAVAIPCHRVVAASGAIGGYRWGGDRKKKLLAREVSAVSATRRAR